MEQKPLLKIAIHQMCSGIDPDRNLARMVEAVRAAGNGGASFYFAPEMSILVDRNRERARRHIVTEAASLALQALSQVARQAGIWVHVGSFPVIADDGTRFANRTIVIDAEGRVRARYDKMHLFDVDLRSGETWRESAAYAPGAGPVAVRCPFGLMGLTICYDVRFPALYAALGEAAVDFIAVPAAFTVPTGEAHWHALLRARAIEAEAFVIAAAQSGSHDDGRQTYGHSLVIDPWGEVILDMGEGEGLGFAELDLGRLDEVRAQIPVHRNRRQIDPPVSIY